MTRTPLSAALLVAAWIALALPASGWAADPVVFAAGDIACDPANPNFNAGQGVGAVCRQQATADLMVDGTFDGVLALGDLQYDSGSLSNFLASYDLSWGRVKPLTYPVVGNHEGTTATSGAGYCSYFGAVAHCAGGRQGGAAFYSFDIGAWHLVVLNSNCVAAGGCEAGSPQYQWLAADLAAHPTACTLAAWHHPRWSSGHDGSNLFMQPLWQLFAGAGGDLVLAGHSHDYERFAPIDASGAVNAADGTSSFVVGTGGEDFTGLAGAAVPGSQVRQNTGFGVLRLVLHATSYDWTFLPAAGSTFTDSGTRNCRGFDSAGDVAPPSVPTAVTATPAGSTRVDVSWTASSDNVGVAGYEIFRATGAGALRSIQATTGTGVGYADTSVVGGQTYRYQVRASDAAGNVSARSATASATTPSGIPSPPVTVTPPTVAGPPPVAGPPLVVAPPLTSPVSNLLAHWRLSNRAARRSLARRWVAIPTRRSAPTIVRVRVGGRLVAQRRVGFRHAFRIRLAPWASRRAERARPVTVTVRRPAA